MAANMQGSLKISGRFRRSAHVGRWGELNTELHALLYSHADSPRMMETMHQLLQSTDRFTRMQLFYTDGRARAEREHEDIVRLCEARNYKAASRMLRDHIMNAGAVLAPGPLRDHKSIIEAESA